MGDLVQCDVHGEGEKAYVCSHLADNGVGLGFNANEPEEEDPFPDAWCDECELIREAHDGWTEETEKLVTVSLLCSGCYEAVRIRNTRTEVTLEDLAGLRWKCHTCEEWHNGPSLDFGYDAPAYWNDEYKSAALKSLAVDELPEWLLTDDLCIIDGKNFFVRGVIQLPIIGTAKTFCWGVWGSLSKASFEKYVTALGEPEQVEVGPMFSWLSNQIDEYDDDTLNLKMTAYIGEPGDRPSFELEPTDHPLSREYHHGITAERVKEIMTKHLREVG